MTKSGIRSWLSLMLSVLLTFMSVAPALAAEAPLSQDPEIAMLQSYGIVIGDGTGDLKLDTTLSRAELATIAVRAMGSEELSKSFENSTLYSDMTGRFAWANRYVAMADSLGAMKGRGNGIFDPGSDITNAEVFTVLLRLVEREPQGAWNPELVMSIASQLGIAEGPTGAMANLPAHRGAIFKALAKAMTRVQLADGTTALHKYIDKTPPALTVDAVPTTANATVTVTGTANGATSVTVNGQAATLNGNRFTASVSLTGGANTIAVVAKDAAGNTATQNITITRSSNAAKIEVTGAASVKPGDTTTIKATAYDSADRALPADAVTAKLSNSLATYDAATGAFKAGSTAGKVTITFTSGTITKDVDVIVGGLSSKVTSLHLVSKSGNAFTVRKNGTIQVQSVDDNGDIVTADQGRQVLLVVSDLSGVAVTPSTATTVEGIATFTVNSSSSGSATLTAISSGLSSDSVDVVFGTGTRVVLVPTKTSAAANGIESVDVRAVLQNENGESVTNSSNTDITVELSGSTREAGITDRHLTIRRGSASSSGYDDGTIAAGWVTETVRLTGNITSSHNYTVVPASITFNKLTTGSASSLEIVGGTSTYDPDRSGSIRLTVKAVDSKGNLLVGDNYAFQVELSTSNKEPLENGLPKGVSLELGRTGQTPVTSATNSKVVARTDNGTAELYLTYDKSGDVTLKLIGVNATDDAISDLGVKDSGLSSRGLSLAQRTVRYAAAVSSVKVVTDLNSPKMSDQPVGVMKTGGTTAKIKVQFVDAKGGQVTNYNDYVSLTAHTGSGTKVSGTQRVRSSGGVAEFTVTSTSVEDIDTWTAETMVNNTPVSQAITIATYSQAPSSADVPSIQSMSSESGDSERVGISDSYLQIQLNDYFDSRYGFVKVFRSGGSVAYTSDVMDLTGTPTVRVPKSALASSDTYYVKVNNGVGDSAKSATWPTTIMVEKPLTIDINSVTFDAVTMELKANGSSIVADSSTGRVDPNRLTLHVASDTGRTHDYNLGTEGATCITSGGNFKCTLASALPTTIFNGRVVLETRAGWYFRTSTGDSAKVDEALSNNNVAPMAHVTGAAVSFGTDSSNHVTGTLYLYGVNLGSSNIYFNQIKLLGANGAVTLSESASKSIANSNGTMVTIALPNYSDSRNEQTSVAYRIKNLPGPIAVNLSAGWLRSGSGNARNGEVVGVQLYAKNPLSTVRVYENAKKLTFSGKGFLDGTFDMSMLSIVTVKSGAVNTVLDLTGHTASGTATDTTIDIELTPTEIAALKAAKGNLYLQSKPVTPGSSWFMNNGLATEQLTDPTKSGGVIQPVGWVTF